MTKTGFSINNNSNGEVVNKSIEENKQLVKIKQTKQTDELTKNNNISSSSILSAAALVSNDYDSSSSSISDKEESK